MMQLAIRTFRPELLLIFEFVLAARIWIEPHRGEMQGPPEATFDRSVEKKLTTDLAVAAGEG